MRASIHPKYYPESKVTCTCGNILVVGSTLPEASIEICAACHPFYTGVDRLVDTEGRVERFERKRAAADPAAKRRKKSVGAASTEKRPKTLKEMLDVGDQPQRGPFGEIGNRE